jgi:hypothetical protein
MMVTEYVSKEAPSRRYVWRGGVVGKGHAG